MTRADRRFAHKHQGNTVTVLDWNVIAPPARLISSHDDLIGALAKKIFLPEVHRPLRTVIVDFILQCELRRNIDCLYLQLATE